LQADFKSNLLISKCLSLLNDIHPLCQICKITNNFYPLNTFFNYKFLGYCCHIFSLTEINLTGCPFRRWKFITFSFIYRNDLINFRRWKFITFSFIYRNDLIKNYYLVIGLYSGFYYWNYSFFSIWIIFSTENFIIELFWDCSHKINCYKILKFIYRYRLNLFFNCKNYCNCTKKLKH